MVQGTITVLITNIKSYTTIRLVQLDLQTWLTLKGDFSRWFFYVWCGHRDRFTPTTSAIPGA